jgi:hypothetical protein
MDPDNERGSVDVGLGAVIGLYEATGLRAERFEVCENVGGQ